MRLSDLLEFEPVVIQCHDSPDADAIASGFALVRYFARQGRSARFVYSGQGVIKKPNLLLMLEKLGICLEHVCELPPCNLLILVDCQYGAGNVTRFTAPRVAVIDHHRQETRGTAFEDIRPGLGSCSTVVWDLLCKAHFPFDREPEVSQALYYGLFMDSNAFSEIAHPLDRDLMESVRPDRGLIKLLCSCAITREELTIMAEALRTPEQVGRFGLFRAGNCDPNLLGFAADIAQQVDSLDCCVVWAPRVQGYKLSVRSSVREIMASEFAAFLTRGVGSGGGGAEKAGGFISAQQLEGQKLSIEAHLRQRMSAYATHYDHIYAGEVTLDLAAMPRYRRQPTLQGYVPTVSLARPGASLLVRTLEGDTELEAAADLYLMIGVCGEVYPIHAANFATSYITTDEVCPTDFEYDPTVTVQAGGDRLNLLPLIQTCRSAGEVIVRAMPLRNPTKIFTLWNTGTYLHGEVGDYLAVREDTPDDVFLVRGDRFGDVYEPVI